MKVYKTRGHVLRSERRQAQMWWTDRGVFLELDLAWWKRMGSVGCGRDFGRRNRVKRGMEVADGTVFLSQMQTPSF